MRLEVISAKLVKMKYLYIFHLLSISILLLIFIFVNIFSMSQKEVIASASSRHVIDYASGLCAVP